MQLSQEIAILTNGTKISLKSSDLETVFLTIFFYVDEIYKEISHFVARPGTKPRFTDSEVISLLLMAQLCNFDSERAWHRFVKKNYHSLFPALISLSRYHRRSKDLAQLTNLIRLVLLEHMDVFTQDWHIMDSMPIPVCEYVRAGRNKRFQYELAIDGHDLYGYCASKKQKIYGFKLHLLVSTKGIPVHFVLAPACHHDVQVAPELVENYRRGITIGTDKGYIGLGKKLEHPQDYRLVIPKRVNQKERLSKQEKGFIRQFRSIVETTNSLLAGQFNIQFCRAKSKRGITSRVINKLTSLTMAIFLNFVNQEPLLQVKSIVF